MYKWLLPLLLICNTAYAGIGVCHDSGNLTRVETDGNWTYYTSGYADENPSWTCSYYSVPPLSANEYQTLLTLIKTTPKRYLKWDNGLAEMTQAEKDAVDAQVELNRDQIMRASAKSRFDGNYSSDFGSPVAMRALVKVLLDEINILRAWNQDFKTVVAGANNLADIKTGVAGLQDTPDRTLAQAKNAIGNAIDNKDVDE